MSRQLIRLGLRLGAAALLASAAACTEYLDRRDTVSFHAGDAVAANRAIHTIDPWPAHASQTAIAHDGERIGKAIERYKRGPQPNGAAAPSTLAIPIAPPPPVD
jgi:type IV pilus biogenesis protein CpaD/CtpE